MSAEDKNKKYIESLGLKWDVDRYDGMLENIAGDINKAQFKKGLTPQERRIFYLLSYGWRAEHIQEFLNITHETYKHHIRLAKDRMDKLGAGPYRALPGYVAFAIRNNLI